MKRQLEIDIADLVMCLSSTVDLAYPSLNNHHTQVAYISLEIGEQLGYNNGALAELLIAASLHDIGAFSMEEKLESLKFDFINPDHHTEVGYNLIKLYEPFSDIADIIRGHHTYWNYGEGYVYRGFKVPFFSHIIHLADRVSVLIDRDREILGQVDSIVSIIDKNKGRLFVPELVEIFKDIASKEYFWFNLVSQNLSDIIDEFIQPHVYLFHMDDLVQLSKLFSAIIDFRSSFTATHSAGVAQCAENIALYMRMDEDDRKGIKAAGYLHDLGKLAIPSEILEKNGRLTSHEYNIMKTHVYYTYVALNTVNGLEEINRWSSYHHERLDGSGYPFHLNAKQLPLGSRIVAVSDIFVALIEERPYKERLSKRQVINIMEGMVKNGGIDGEIMSILKWNYGYIYDKTAIAQTKAKELYEKIKESLS